MDMTRVSGILLHPTSLPGRYGIGELGEEAYRWVDFLAQTGQSLWQILPLGPTGYGNSPYMCFSACAGNRLLISLDKLFEEGLLDRSDLDNVPDFPVHKVDYPAVIRFKLALLEKSFQRFKAGDFAGHRDEFYNFCQQQAFWLEDYALFRALKEVYDGRAWVYWEAGVARREPEALIGWRNKLIDAVQFHKYLQYLFFGQWAALRQYCHQRGIRIIGDIPIYVAHDSADVWAHRDLFYLDEQGHPTIIAGVPPDYYSATGQRWGNPIYRWDVVAQRGFHWWIERMHVNLSQVDIIRIDHFRGLEAYWEIPATEQTAINGRWVKGPGDALFDALRAALGDLPLIAEDLGVITPEVEALRDQFNLPGMRILQMAFGTNPKAPDYRPHSHIRNCIVYTATHDHNTTVGWFTAPPGTETTQTAEEIRQERGHILKYIGQADGQDIHWKFIRMALGSVAHWAIFPLQDLLGLDSRARMNRPGTASGNWEWRYTPDMLTKDITAQLSALTRLYERAPHEVDHDHTKRYCS